MNKFINFCLIICAFTFLEWACHDCNLVSAKLLTDQQKSQNPFNGFEKIIFNSGDSIIEFTGTGRQDTIKKYNISNSRCDWGVREFDELMFTNENKKILIQLTGLDELKMFLFDQKNSLNMLATMHTDHSTGEFSDYVELIDSLVFNNSLYFKIYKDTMVVSYPNDIPDSVKRAIYLYYTIDFGIVKIDFSDGSSWELEKIEWN